MIALAPKRATRSSPASLHKARRLRLARKLANTCINGTTPATNGCRCLRCHLVYTWGAESAKRKPEYDAAPICNPNARRRR